MNNTTKTILGIIVLALIIWSITSLSDSEPASGESIKIGAILPLTGNLARYGELETEGLEMVREEINKKGGIDGRLIEIIYEDSQAKPAQAVSAWQKLTTQDDFPVIITAISSVCQALSPLANDQKIVLMSTECAVAEYSTPDDYTFRILSSNAEEGKQMAEYLVGKNVLKIAVLQIANDYGHGLYNSFSEHYTKNGGTVVIKESYTSDQRDFRTQLTKIKELSADALYIMSYAPDAEVLIKQVDELGMELPIYAAEPFENAQLLINVGELVTGVIYLRPQISTEAGFSFADRYRERFNKEAEITPARSYDALATVVSALKACSSRDEVSSDCVKDELYKLRDFEGIIGTINFDENGDVNLPYVVKTVKDGKFVLYEE